MASSHEFHPDWASAPGDTIADILKERGLSVTEFAQGIGRTTEQAEELLQGRTTISIGTARRLERLLGASVAFWMARDFQYRQDVTRIDAPDEGWLAELPLGDMVKFGWLKPAPRPSDELATCLRFFDVPSLQAWRDKYSSLQATAFFRKSPSFESRLAAVAAWLRQGEIASGAIRCDPWNPTLFKDALLKIKALTRYKDPDRFIPELQKLCARCGVAVVVVRAPNGCSASGATYFVSPTRALLLLSFRYLSDDQFWFTFFHEAGHILLHDEKALFLEGAEGPLTNEERQANEFAEQALIPADSRPTMLRLSTDYRQVIRFAQRLGVSPGIIVGQLQHYERIDRDQLNFLKRRFKWQVERH